MGKPTVHGLRAVTTVWAQKLGEPMLRRYYKSWYASKKKAFTKHSANFDANKEQRETALARLTKNATVIRVLAHTQPNKLKLGMKKARGAGDACNQVHRHQQQAGPRALPDADGAPEVHGPAQEGPGEGGEVKGEVRHFSKDALISACD